MQSDEMLDFFVAYQTRRGVKPSTQRTYGQYLRPFLGWLDSRDISTLTVRDIEVEWLPVWSTSVQGRIGREPSARTLRNHLIALRVFFAFLHRHEFIPRNPLILIEVPRVVRRRNDWLNDDEWSRLIGAAVRPVERIVVPLFRWTGMRSAEAESLLVGEVDFAAGKILVSASKTPAGIRTIPIFPPLIPYLEEWQLYQARRGVWARDLPLLATSSACEITHTQVWITVKRVAGRAGVRPRVPEDRDEHNVSTVSPHTLRRTFATDLLNRGVRVEVVSKLLGHTNSRTTEESYAELLDTTVASEALAVFDR
jgi:integrase